MYLPAKTTLISRSALGLLVLFAASSALRADGVFLSMGNVSGQAQEAGHENWIECQSLAFGVARDAQMGTSYDGSRSSVQFSEITLKRQMDVSSPELFFLAAQGRAVDGPVVIEFTRSGDHQPVVYLRVELERVAVTSYSVSASTPGSKDGLTENVTLKFAVIKMTYVVPSVDGRGDYEITRQWNVEKGAEA